MVRPAYFFATIISLLLVICSWSLAQESSPDDPILPLTGQEWTELDTGEEVALELISTGDANFPLSGEYLSGTNDTGGQSGEVFLETGVIPETGNIVLPTPLPTGQAGPLLLISEIFFDGSDERLELTNLGSVDFSGAIQLTGIGINTTLSVAINSGGSVVIGRTGRTFSYILDTSVIGYFASMGFTDTRMISVNLFWSGQLLDSFFADTGMVTHYNDRSTSLERIWQNGTYIVTGTTIDRQLNVSSAYLANPGSFQITWLDFSSGSGENNGLSGQLSGADNSGSQAMDCNQLISAPPGRASPPLQISELFRGNEQRDFYIEILALQDFTGDEIILSGSFLTSPTIISLSGVGNHLQQGRRLIISSGRKRHNEQILVVDNQGLAPSKSGGFLQILLGSGQSGQVMDIVSISDERVGSSLYFRGNSSGCIRKMDTRGRFSPGFDEALLRYFPGSTGYKIICDKPVAISGPVSPSAPPPIIVPIQTGTNETQSGIVFTGNIRGIHITNINYDPEGSDTNNETITLEGDMPLGEAPLFLQRPDRYLKIGTTKRYLSGVLIPGSPTTLQGSFSFPNSSTSGGIITVQLWYKNELMDVYAYLPTSTTTPKTTLDVTGTFLVTSVVDGDTFKIAYKTGEQSIRLLGLDAPEISLLRTKKKGCFADESKAYLEYLILGKEVRLQYDATQNKTDSYKRRLNYVYVDDVFVNEELLAHGYAKEYTFKVPYLMRSEFLFAQEQAQENKLGLWDVSICPENALTGKNMLSGDLLTGEEFFSGWEAEILWIIPNPKGSDAHEQISLRIETWKDGNMETGMSFLSGFSFLINGKTKKIKDSIPLNQETMLSGNFSFPNKAACVSLVFGKITLDTLCYPQPKEGETIYADGRKDFVLNSAEQTVVSSVSLKKIGNTMCAFYGNLQIDCNNIPSGKTALKTKNENKLYESFINILQPYLQQNRGNVFYQSNVYPYFTLLWAAKKNISAGLVDVQTSHGAVPVYDLSAQLHVIETFSPGYWAKRFGQVLLNEI